VDIIEVVLAIGGIQLTLVQPTNVQRTAIQFYNYSTIAYIGLVNDKKFNVEMSSTKS
jgi:hypothetical protein